MPHDDVAGACLTLLRITRPAWFMVYEGGGANVLTRINNTKRLAKGSTID
jgi:hypothetical protein